MYDYHNISRNLPTNHPVCFRVVYVNFAQYDKTCSRRKYVLVPCKHLQIFISIIAIRLTVRIRILSIPQPLAWLKTLLLFEITLLELNVWGCCKNSYKSYPLRKYCWLAHVLHEIERHGDFTISLLRSRSCERNDCQQIVNWLVLISAKRTFTLPRSARLWSRLVDIFAKLRYCNSRYVSVNCCAPMRYPGRNVRRAT